MRGKKKMGQDTPAQDVGRSVGAVRYIRVPTGTIGQASSTDLFTFISLERRVTWQIGLEIYLNISYLPQILNVTMLRFTDVYTFHHELLPAFSLPTTTDIFSF